ncbi:MAG TPA: response regulator transcription factor [Actinobacteria bacterium]|nr:response regulator transcription factor [Actinomycetota bacterium]
MEGISVMVVDDHNLMRQGLRRILEESDMRVVAEAENGEQAVALSKEFETDVILMDIQMPIMDGIEATRIIKKSNKDATVVILTMHEEEQFLFEAIKAGAIGYLLKSRAPQELIQVIQAANDGLSLLQPSMASKLLNEFSNMNDRQNSKSSQLESLTSREKEVLSCIAKGMSNKEIAAQLFISDKTVKNHLSNIFHKLHVNDRTSAAVMALKEGLVD